MIGLVDLPVSLAGLAGLEFGTATDGRDLHRLFTDAGSEGLDRCYIFDQVPCHQSMDRGTPAWKGIVTLEHTYAQDDRGRPWVLFDDERDPYQQVNLVGDPAARSLLSEMRKRLAELTARHGDLDVPWPEMIERRGLKAAWNRSQRHFGREPLP